MADSTITIEGNLTADPELNFSEKSGNAFARMRVAVSRSRKVNDEWVEETSFLSATAFGTLAENVSASLSKGDRVIVSGTIQQRTVEQDDGTNREYVSINADAVGPSLRWATAAVTRNEKKSGGGGAKAAASGDFFGPEEDL